METLKTLSDAPILIPNHSHHNFTQTDEFIPMGKEIEGRKMIVNGKRRGEPFTYRMFQIDKEKFIYLNKVKENNMEATEIKLGVSGEQTQGTVVTLPSKLNNTTLITMAALGLGAVYYSNKKGYDFKKKVIIAGLAVVAGYFIGNKINDSKITIFKKK